MAAHKEMKQVVDGTAGGQTLLLSKCGQRYKPLHSQREGIDAVANGLVTSNYGLHCVAL